MELSEFLLARIAEDEAAAQAAEAGPWTADGGEVWAGHPSWSVVDYARGGGGTADHIARWDPARVLVECEAKRRIVMLGQVWNKPETYGPNRGHVRGDDYAHGVRHAVEVVLFQLALPYAEHPDYDAAWSPLGATA